MELKRVELYNFSSYAGKSTFDFSTSKDKNIILIGGNNGAGKTSLFTAIKLALYGPLCFRYQGKNAQYSARIKELMNHDAFMGTDVKTYVEIEVTLPLHQNYSTYTIHREWNYSGQKVHEIYWVSDKAGVLSPRDRDYFQNYLFTVIPPNMFEFFFFDGEEISDFFSDSSYNSYIKNAVLTLCGYLSHGIESKNAFLSCCEAILSITIETNTLNSELLKLKRDIGSFNEEAGEKIQQDIQRVEKKIKDAEYRKAQNDFQLNDARQNLADLEALLAQYSQANNASAKSQRKLNYTQRLESTFENYLQQLLEEKRKTVEEKATEVFLSITNNPKKYRGIRINSDYRLLLELTDGEQYEIEPGRMLNPSTGQSKVISLSYIAGLNKSSNYAAPIIIDNPLGLFSDEHREAITNYLPHFGKQIIFMVSSGDLTDKYRQIIAPYVKTEYYLDNVGDSTWPKTTIAHKEVY